MLCCSRVQLFLFGEEHRLDTKEQRKSSLGHGKLNIYVGMLFGTHICCIKITESNEDNFLLIFRTMHSAVYVMKKGT